MNQAIIHLSGYSKIYLNQCYLPFLNATEQLRKCTKYKIRVQYGPSSWRTPVDTCTHAPIKEFQ